MSHKLRFTPLAWAKWMWMTTHHRQVEISGFAITADNDPLLVEDIWITKQECTAASVELPDDAMALMMEDLCMGLHPKRVEQCTRIWLHTHPGNSPSPSSTDISTFENILSKMPWTIMGIMAKDYSTHVRLYRREPFLRWDVLECGVDWTSEVTPEWEQEVQEQVTTRGRWAGGDETPWNRREKDEGPVVLQMPTAIVRVDSEPPVPPDWDGLKDLIDGMPLEERKPTLERLSNQLTENSPDFLAQDDYVWWLWDRVTIQEKNKENSNEPAKNNSDQTNPSDGGGTDHLKLVGSPPDGPCGPGAA